MKNALILHGTDADHTANWFPWLDRELTSLGYKVWTPDLPDADKPSIEKYNNFLLNHRVQAGDWGMSWQFNNESIIIGHSSGAVEILGLLNDPKFPKDIKVRACFLVGAFKGSLGWDSLTGMIADFNYDLIKSKSQKLVFIHSNDDPHCPIDDARDLCITVDGKFIELKDMGHFSGNEYKLSGFPKLLEIIKEETQ